MLDRVTAALTAGAICICSTAAAAQQNRVLADSASPFDAVKTTNADAALVRMPELSFTPSGDEAGDFDKYYFFHRPDTDFATAYADIAECDGNARDLQSNIAYQDAPYPYTGTVAGAAGGLLGNLLAQAIAGSAEKRRLRRVNMRTCMNFKGYDRYGLSKSVWSEFNFEEGLSEADEARRERCLKQQALAASAGKPSGKVLGL